MLVFALASVAVAYYFVAGLIRRKAETAIRAADKAHQTAWLASLKQDPPTDITSEEILNAIHEGRAERDVRRSRRAGSP